MNPPPKVICDQTEQTCRGHHQRGTGQRSRRARGTPIDFWQVMGFESANRPQEAGWMIAHVAQRDVQPAIIHPAWLAY